MNPQVRQAIADLLELSASTSSHKWLALVLDDSLEPAIHTPAEKAEIRSYLGAADQKIDKSSREPIRIELQETVALRYVDVATPTFLTPRTLLAINLFDSKDEHQGLLVALSIHSDASDPQQPDALIRIAQLAEKFIAAGASGDQSQEELEYSFSINRAILNTLYDAVVMTDVTGRIQSVNPALERMFGYPEKELIGQPITKLMPSDTAKHHPGYMKAYANGKTSGQIMGNVRAVKGKRADGTQFTLQIAITETTVRNERLLVGAMQDITESEEARINLERFRKTLDSTADCVFMFDADSLRFFYVNQGALDQLGYEQEELLTLHPYDVKPLYSELEFRIMVVPLVNGEVRQVNFQTPHRHKDGHDIPVDVLLQYVELENDSPRFIAVVRDISELQRQQAEIEHLAYYDPLTSLPNRSLIRTRLEECLQTCKARNTFGTVMLTDLDDFKTVNDTLGHRNGDELLVELSNRFVEVLGSRSNISRLGGDEFLVVLNTCHTDYDEAVREVTEIAKNLLTATSQPTDILGSARAISTSIGIVVFNNGDTSPGELMRMSDIAMYDAKKKGKNYYSLFDNRMQQQLLEEHQLTADLSSALERGEEIVPWFQPKVDQQGRFTGFEALARWHHPERGLLNPVSFIELAEKKNLIAPLSQLILTQACHQMSQWRGQFDIDHWTVSVNISQSQLAQVDFPDTISGVLADTGLPAHALILEVTESVVAENIEASIRQMDRLRSIGVRFSMDDFGTGYSSLSYIRQLPINELKIDKSFVDTLLTDSESHSIVRVILLLSDALGLTVVAEGIESEEQWRALTSLGCPGFQGYYFSRPQPADGILEALCQQHE
jgi:diguanylate cyclase (GGDEF)-like protein/PAS domain S-box-containing protein